MSQTALKTAAPLPDRNFAAEVRIKTHLKETSSPETCPDVSWTKPPQRQDFIKIFTFELSPQKRPDRMRAPCPICSPFAPKYYHGVLAWFPLERVYRLIGHECAAHFIGHEQARAADREFKARTEHNGNFSFAFDNLGNVPAMMRYMHALLKVSLHVDGLLDALGRAHVRGRLYNIGKANQGRLRLWNTTVVEQPDPITGKLETFRTSVQEDCGPLRGWMALGKSVRPTKDIRIEIERLSHLDRGEGDDAQSWVVENGYDFPDDLLAFRKSVSRAMEVRRKALAQFEEIRDFFTEANFKRLTAYGADTRNPHQFYASESKGEYKIGEIASVAVRLRPNFTGLYELPPWPDAITPNS